MELNNLYSPDLSVKINLPFGRKSIDQGISRLSAQSDKRIFFSVGDISEAASSSFGVIGVFFGVIISSLVSILGRTTRGSLLIFQRINPVIIIIITIRMIDILSSYSNCFKSADFALY